MGLMDLTIKGCRFSWYSNPRNGFVTREKLDKILVNWEWRSLFPDAIAISIPSTSSDHTPIILWPKPKLRSGNYFKFEAFWEEHEECKEIVQQAWDQVSIDSQERDIFLKKAEHCKSSLQKWHQRTFRRPDKQISQLSQELQLKDNAGNWVQGQNDIERLVLDHYNEVYKAEPTEGVNDCLQNLPKKVTFEMNEVLMRPVSAKEVQATSFSMGAHKAPGPDGLNGLFYQKHWEVVKEDVVALVQDFFSNGIIKNEINETLVALVPKVPSLETIVHYRPISCCNYI
ncbi:Endonuclease/exonuclease/phosphatase superfamily [Sesbania bispinosa]|nr:Endonuclease/exonuclease/phosphatase superfamily [Sesbania bispinosa]